jgi:hypothetical protein
MAKMERAIKAKRFMAAASSKGRAGGADTVTNFMQVGHVEFGGHRLRVGPGCEEHGIPECTPNMNFTEQVVIQGGQSAARRNGGGCQWDRI